MNTLSLALASLVLGGCVAEELETAPSETGLSLSPAAAQQILDLVNYPGTTVTTLDVAAKLDSRAAANIIAARDGGDRTALSGDDVLFATIAQLDKVPLVGDAAFAKLATYAAAHPAPTNETVKGIAFKGWEAEAVVWGVDHATTAQLDALIDDRAATNLVAKRPFTTVTQMGPVAYVGAAALTHLLGNAHAWWTAMHATTPANCVASFSDAVTPHLGDLLFLSESDRPINVVEFPGAGTAAPTAAALLALVHAPAGSTTEVRAVADYFVAFEPNLATSDPNASAAVQAAVAAQLTDVLYLAVHQPAGSIDQALVDVYLIGRTSCGDLVGLHAIAVET